MVIRVDTTNITRGADFSVFIQTSDDPAVSLYAFNSATHDFVELPFTIEKSGIFFNAISKSPTFDGYLLAKINGKSILVKKIGNPTPHFVIGYRENFTVQYRIFNSFGEETKVGNLINITDGFYYCEISYDNTIIETLKKRFILQNYSTKLDYDVTLGDAVMSDVVLPNYEFNTVLGDAALGDVSLCDINVDVTLAQTEIRSN